MEEIRNPQLKGESVEKIREPLVMAIEIRLTELLDTFLETEQPSLTKYGEIKVLPNQNPDDENESCKILELVEQVPVTELIDRENLLEIIKIQQKLLGALNIYDGKPLTEANSIELAEKVERETLPLFLYRLLPTGVIVPGKLRTVSPWEMGMLATAQMSQLLKLKSGGISATAGIIDQHNAELPSFIKDEDITALSASVMKGFDDAGLLVTQSFIVPNTRQFFQLNKLTKDTGLSSPRSNSIIGSVLMRKNLINFVARTSVNPMMTDLLFRIGVKSPQKES